MGHEKEEVAHTSAPIPLNLAGAIGQHRRVSSKPAGIPPRCPLCHGIKKAQSVSSPTCMPCADTRARAAPRPRRTTSIPTSVGYRTRIEFGQQQEPLHTMFSTCGYLEAFVRYIHICTKEHAGARGWRAKPRSIRYIGTLDTDTQHYHGADGVSKGDAPIVLKAGTPHKPTSGILLQKWFHASGKCFVPKAVGSNPQGG